MERKMNSDSGPLTATITEFERERKKEKERAFALIKDTLSDNNIEYMCDPDQFKIAARVLTNGNKVIWLRTMLHGTKVIGISVGLPFSTQCNSLVLMAMYIAGVNSDKELPFSYMNMDPDTGEVSMEYQFLLNEDRFAKDFKAYMDSAILLAQDVYARASYLAVGKVPEDIKWKYKKLLDMSLTVLNEKRDVEEEVFYGSDCLEEPEEDSDFDDDIPFNGLDWGIRDGISEEDSEAMSKTIEEYLGTNGHLPIPEFPDEEIRKDIDSTENEELRDNDDLLSIFEDMDIEDIKERISGTDSADKEE